MLLLVVGLQLAKTIIVTLVARLGTDNSRKALRVGIVMAQGGEFGFALLTLMLSDMLADSAMIQPLLAATVVSMVVEPAADPAQRPTGGADLPARRRRAPVPRPGTSWAGSAITSSSAASAASARTWRACWSGRASRTSRSIRIRAPSSSRGAPAMRWSTATARRPEILEAVGLERCRVLVLTFAEPTASMKIVRSVRELRPELPILVRTQDDTKLEELQQAGATEVVPETLEASLMLASHVLLLLDVPVSRVVKTIGDIRNNRYSMLRRLFRRDDARHGRTMATRAARSCTPSCCRPVRTASARRSRT